MSSAGWPVAFSQPTKSESESERPPQWPGPPTLHPTAPRSRQWKPWHSSPPINTTHLHSLSSGVFTTSTSTTIIIIILTAVRAQRQLFRFSRDRFYVSAAGKRGENRKLVWLTCSPSEGTKSGRVFTLWWRSDSRDRILRHKSLTFGYNPEELSYRVWLDSFSWCTMSIKAKAGFDVSCDFPA